LRIRRVNGLRAGTIRAISVPPSSGRREESIANLLVRGLNNDEVLKRLEAAAKAHGRSLEEEIREILRAAAMRSLAETRRLSARWLRRLDGAKHSDSATLLRGDRDTR